jgi:hypothetical protein
VLDYLPLRPGMMGRIAYHKAVHGIEVLHSVRVLFIGMAFGAAAVLTALAISAALGAGAAPRVWAASLGAPALLAAIVTLATARSNAWWLPCLYLIRYLDMLAWILRYWLVFRVIGAPIGPGQAAALATVCQLALNIPLFGNGLGLREWGVGVTASKLPAGVLDARGGLTLSTGLTAELVNRIAELVVSIPIGLLAFVYLSRKARPLPPTI